jgi:hypothetical protein
MLKATAPLAALALVIGCAVERPVQSYNEDVEAFDESAAVGNVEASTARIFGDIGALENFDEQASISGYDDGSYANLEVVAENDDGAAMHWIDIYGGLNNPALTPGTRMTFVAGDYPESASDLHMEAMACQGNTAYAWDYDEQAEEVDVTVSETEDPSTIKIDYTTRVPSSGGFGLDEDRVSSGSFLLTR